MEWISWCSLCTFDSLTGVFPLFFFGRIAQSAAPPKSAIVLVGHGQFFGNFAAAYYVKALFLWWKIHWKLLRKFRKQSACESVLKLSDFHSFERACFTYLSSVCACDCHELFLNIFAAAARGENSLQREDSGTKSLLNIYNYKSKQDVRTEELGVWIALLPFAATADKVGTRARFCVQKRRHVVWIIKLKRAVWCHSFNGGKIAGQVMGDCSL